ncbi:lysophospholipid acyltransferase family protein [Calidifontibacter indicus]|uniref:1-acyl-sn-glycerol-3-phosphate acyltransferase n=1 Tax=Calidifontibacter indicus TaxID=419650 RepID=A0A3D9UXW8_9MICO|nr:lysophospholipid acyltransferase family protein [Calidifontibacter indicus]REF31425.1 1-acyl-sn-glycerol-3-phosphate acyltransferase [Calidifontibacter indicus]
MLYWFLKRVVVGPILNLLFRPWVDGEQNIPEKGAAIFASNHLSFSDSFFLPLVVPRRMTFVAKADYFTGTGMKGRLTAAFFRGVGQIPIDRSGGAASSGALQSGLSVLRKGEFFGIYPEGTRSPDGRLYKGKTGVARLALEAKVPVIPVAMIDTDKAQPTGKVLPKIMRIGIRVGKPLDFSRYEGMQDDRFVLRSITDEIMYELMLLSGQEYVDVYASTVKDRIAARAKEIGGTAVAVGSGAAQAIGQRVARKSGEDEKSADGAEPDSDEASVADDVTGPVTDIVTDTAKAPGAGA